MDVCDQTDIRMEIEDELRKKARDKPHAVSEDCVECGDVIPQARQEATNGTDLCISCQSFFEQRQRAYS